MSRYEAELVAKISVVYKKVNEQYARQRAIRRALTEDLRAWDADELEREAMLYALDGNSDILSMYRSAETVTHSSMDAFIENALALYGAEEPPKFSASQKMIFDLLHAYWARATHVMSKGMSLRLSDQHRKVGDLLLQMNHTRMVDLVRELASAEGEAAETLARRVAHEVLAAASAANSHEVDRLARAVEGLQLAEEAKKRIGFRVSSFIATNSVAVGVNMGSAVLAKLLGLPV